MVRLGTGTHSGWSSSLPGGIFISTKPAPRLQNLVWRQISSSTAQESVKKRSVPGLVHSVCNFIYTLRDLENFTQTFKNVFLLKFFFLFFFKKQRWIKKKEKEEEKRLKF